MGTVYTVYAIINVPVMVDTDPLHRKIFLKRIADLDNKLFLIKCVSLKCLLDISFLLLIGCRQTVVHFYSTKLQIKRIQEQVSAYFQVSLKLSTSTKLYSCIAHGLYRSQYASGATWQPKWSTIASAVLLMYTL